LIIYSRRTRGGVEGDHFLVCPPMISTDEHVEEIIGKLTIALEQFESRAMAAIAQNPERAE
jgi:adenosylmethionine-8-amino-7-oxononanoate aminotransferase